MRTYRVFIQIEQQLDDDEPDADDYGEYEPIEDISVGEFDTEETARQLVDVLEKAAESFVVILPQAKP